MPTADFTRRAWAERRKDKLWVGTLAACVQGEGGKEEGKRCAAMDHSMSDTDSDSESSSGWTSGTTSPGMSDHGFWTGSSDTESLSSDNEYPTHRHEDEDQMWADMDQALADGGDLSNMRLPSDFGSARDHRDDPKKAARAADAKRSSAKTALEVAVKKPQLPKAKPLRMTMQDGHRAGDVCYARVPSTGQRIAGHVPVGLNPGDQFIVMYVPEGSPSVKGEPGANSADGDAAAAAVAAEKARDPARSLDVPDLLPLLNAPSWGTAEPLNRPLRFEDPIEEVLFREPRLLKRRQKVSVGVIDRWKNSGGKRAVVVMPIALELQRGENNVLVARHGRVLRADGTQLRYRQWSFGTQTPSGELKESNKEDFILYQIFSEAAAQSGTVAPLEREAADGTPFSSPSPPLLAEADLESPKDPTGPSSWPPQQGQGGVKELDFSLLGHSVAKRTFDFDAGQDPLDGMHQKQKKRPSSSLAPFLIGKFTSNPPVACE